MHQPRFYIHRYSGYGMMCAKQRFERFSGQTTAPLLLNLGG
jgi:hypothetical protein